MKSARSARSARWPYIPEDIVACEILPRLPAKALVRLQCVSKSWKSLISNDPYFARLQLAHACSSPAVLLASKKPEPTLICADPTSVGFPNLSEQLSILSWRTLRIMASCKGILCIMMFSTDSQTVLLYVGNPVLDKWLWLPPPFFSIFLLESIVESLDSTFRAVQSIGLAVYEMERPGVGYKLVVLFYFKNSGGFPVAGFMVLGTTTEPWEICKETVLMNDWPGLEDDYATNVEETLFWKHNEKVIWFDAKEERSGTFFLPLQFKDCRRQSLAEWNGCLSCMMIAEGEILIWSRNQSFWSKRLLLTIETIARENFDFFAFLGLRMNLRNRKSESLEAILQRSSVDVVAFAANFILLAINKKYICYDAITGKAWRLLKGDFSTNGEILRPYVNSLLELKSSQVAE